ncbi:hypothetical protein [Streptomyces sp. NRRL F-2747]|uniref:hypothetical protein n=1 Tax=Streptomyces sp. NRRL F-2747 TaxID=1463843 RepID=UPI0004C585B2|nr:hypothetical protein [Streptomyces sp. NRRL F-2747]
MLTPKYPKPDTYTPVYLVPEPAAVPMPTAPAPAPAPAARPTVQLTPGSVVALAASGGAVVLVIGTVLVSMLLAVAITAASVAVCAVVIRSLLNNPKGH